MKTLSQRDRERVEKRRERRRMAVSKQSGKGNPSEEHSQEEQSQCRILACGRVTFQTENLSGLQTLLTAAWLWSMGH